MVFGPGLQRVCAPDQMKGMCLCSLEFEALRESLLHF